MNEQERNDNPVAEDQVTDDETKLELNSSEASQETTEKTSDEAATVTSTDADSLSTAPAESTTAEQFDAAPELPNVDDIEPEQPLVAETASPVLAAPTTVDQSKSTNSRKKRMITLLVTAGLLLIAILVAWWLVTQNNSTTSADNSSQSVAEAAPAKLGVAVTVADGTVEYAETDAWQTLTIDSDVELGEGFSVRTGKDSRAVLTLDDGSAVRLDANTVVRLVSLVADAVVLEQVEGAVYSRVAPSERQYTVTVGDTSYQALGTAFVTVKDDKTSGVQVFESSVKVTGLDGAVQEGKQYYVANANSAIQGKVTGIELAQLVSNKFVAWNVAEDKKDAKFKSHLGMLEKFDQVAAEQAAVRKAEAEAKKAAEEAARQAAEAAEKARLEAERKARQAATSGLTVSLLDGGISWNYAKTAQYGFKVLYSATNPTPVFREAGTVAVYVEEPAARFLHIPKDIKVGKIYYVRVCVYEPNNPNGPCPVYSNVLQLRRTS